MKLYMLLLCCIVVLVNATTWTSVEKECPICGTKSRYFNIASYGSYVFDYPSKYEYIFWPYTDGKVVYSCRKCWFSCFMWDFEDIPESKHNDIRKFLDSLDLHETNGDYYVVPMSYRLLIAEKIYRFLDKDDEFWCHFYRVMGHHLANEEKTVKATQARTKAINIAEKMLQQKKYDGAQKELYVITGAMKYHLGNKQGALDDFKKAQKLTYEKTDLDKESLENSNRYLSDLLDDYIEKIGEIKRTQVVFSATPTIAELVESPEMFVDSIITVTGRLVNQGTGSLEKFQPALADITGNVVEVLSWAPLEVFLPMNPDIPIPKAMGYYLYKTIKANGYFRKDDKGRFNSDYYFKVIQVNVISE